MGFGYNIRRGAARPGNTRARDLLGDERYTEAVADFLRTTKLMQIKEGVITKRGKKRRGEGRNCERLVVHF